MPHNVAWPVGATVDMPSSLTVSRNVPPAAIMGGLAVVGNLIEPPKS